MVLTLGRALAFAVLLGGLLSIGILAEYVAKLYFEAKRRPRFFIAEQV